MVIDQDKIYRWPNVPYYYQMLGPYGEVNIQIANDVDRTKALDGFFCWLVDGHGTSSAIPDDDREHVDNYAPREIKIDNLQYRAAYTYTPNYNVPGIAYIMNFETETLETKILYPTEVYNFGDYEYLIDVRYLHNECRYSCFVKDRNRATIFFSNLATEMPAAENFDTVEDWYIYLKERNEISIRAPEYMTYRLNPRNVIVQSSNTYYMHEWTNLNIVGMKILLTIKNEDKGVGYSVIIDTTSINKLTSGPTQDANSIYTRVVRYHSTGYYNIQNFIRTTSGAMGNVSNADNYFIAILRFEDYINYEEGDEISFEWDILDNEGCIIFSGSGDNLNMSSHIKTYVYNVYDSNFKIQFNDN